MKGAIEKLETHEEALTSILLREVSIAYIVRKPTIVTYSWGVTILLREVSIARPRQMVLAVAASLSTSHRGNYTVAATLTMATAIASRRFPGQPLPSGPRDNEW